MRVLSPLAMLFIAPVIHAQQVSWMGSWPTETSSGVNSFLAQQLLVQGPGNELLSVRQTHGAFVYSVDVFGQQTVERLDAPTGNVVWSCALTDSVVVDAITMDAAGNAYVAGRFMGDLQRCDGASLPNILPEALWNVDLFLMAISADGTPLWMRDLSVDHAEAGRVAALAVDPQGRPWYCIGEFGLSRIIRVDGEGNDAETRIIDGATLIGSMDFDPWGGLYVSGATDTNGFAFGGQSYQFEPGSGYQMFVLRYDASGAAGFAQFAADVTFQRPTVLDDGQGHAYLGGELMVATTWGGLQLHGPQWVYDSFLAKLDSTGQFLWALESAPDGDAIEGDVQRSYGPCIAVDGAANVYFMGDVRGAVHWSGSVSSDAGPIPQSGCTIVKFDPNGTPQWAVTSSPDEGGSASRTLTADAAGVVHFALLALNAFTLPPITVNSDGGQDAVVGELMDATTGVATVLSSPDDLSIWPNPASDALHIQWSGTPTTVTMLDATGRIVRTLRLMNGLNTLDLTDAPSGLYLLRTTDGQGARVVRH